MEVHFYTYRRAYLEPFDDFVMLHFGLQWRFVKLSAENNANNKVKQHVYSFVVTLCSPSK